MKGLIIESPYIDMILDGIKTWEMRSTKTKIRGEIFLIRKGSGTIVGRAKLVDSLDYIMYDDLSLWYDRHRVQVSSYNRDTFKWNYPWVLSDVFKIEPIPYIHPRGAVIWVNFH